MGTTLFAFAILVVAFSTFAHRLGRWNVTAPIAFVVAGSLIGFWTEPPTASEVLWIKPVAETTLALVLFHDAAQVRPRDMAADRGLAARAAEVERVQVRGQTRALPKNPTRGNLSSGGLY